MKMTDVDTKVVKKPVSPKKDLSDVIPSHIQQHVNAEQINDLISKNVNQKMSQSDYSNMMFIDNLPSKYLKYPEGTKIYGRPFNIDELIKLSNINEITALTIIDDMIRATVKGINVNDILIGDKIYILLWLRANTYPESGYSVPFTCGKCQNESTYDFKVDNMDINYIREDFNVEDPVELPNKDFLVFKYLTIGDEERIRKFKQSMTKSFTKYNDDILLMAAAISTINGEKKSLVEIYDYIKDPKIYSQVKGYLNNFDFGVSNILNVKCNKCGGTAPVGITFQSDFFLPNYQFDQFTRNDV
jgi:hypothetical protein